MVLSSAFNVTRVKAVAAATVLAGSLGLASFSFAYSDRIAPGVSVDGTPIGGLSYPAARHLLNDVAGSRIHDINFNYDGATFTVRPDDINLTPDIDGTIRQAAGIDSLPDKLRAFLFGVNLHLAANFDEQLLTDRLNDIAGNINRDPVNASCDLVNGAVIKSGAVIGKALDVDKVTGSLHDPLIKLNFPTNINLVPDDIQPFISDADIAAIDSVLGSYTTYYYPGARGDNINLAADAIDHTLVRPAWSFSFNNTVGPRSPQRGFKPAPVIINGKSDIDFGGGVCQVSSTLYNAVLLAGLTPTDRTPHFFQSNYIGYARDATVADGLIDFQFRNDLNNNVYIISDANDYSLSVYVLGSAVDHRDIDVVLEGNSLYRLWYADNVLVNSEYLHSDVYETPKPKQT